MELSLDAIVTTNTQPPPSSPTSPSEGVLDAAPDIATRRPRTVPPPLPSNAVLVEKCHAFLARMRQRVPAWVIERMHETYGPIPNDPSDLSFWMALVRNLVHYQPCL